MSNPTAATRDLYRNLVERYLADGYTQAGTEALPRDLQSPPPDLIFTRGDLIVVVELKRASEYIPLQAETPLTRLASQLRRHANIRLDVVSVPDPIDVLPDPELIASRVEAARAIADQAIDEYRLEGALLLATAALEGSLMRLLRANEVSLMGKAGAAALAAAAWSEGLITQGQWDDLQRLIARRNAIAHGLRSGLSVSRKDVDSLLFHATTFASPDFDEALKLVKWFFERYKSPADGVPFDSARGGYQYFNGGPYRASDVLEREFANKPYPVRDLAVEHIESYGSDWVGINDY